MVEILLNIELKRYEEKWLQPQEIFRLMSTLYIRTV